jgi:hypothetical protein
MEPASDFAALRAHVQERHLEHVLIEIELGRTFLRLVRFERDCGESDLAEAGLSLAEKAINGSRRGLHAVRFIEQERRVSVEAEIRSLEAALAQLKSSS